MEAGMIRETVDDVIRGSGAHPARAKMPGVLARGTRDLMRPALKLCLATGLHLERDRNGHRIDAVRATIRHCRWRNHKSERANV